MMVSCQRSGCILARRARLPSRCLRHTTDLARLIRPLASVARAHSASVLARSLSTLGKGLIRARAETCGLRTGAKAGLAISRWYHVGNDSAREQPWKPGLQALKVSSVVEGKFRCEMARLLAARSPCPNGLKEQLSAPRIGESDMDGSRIRGEVDGTAVTDLSYNAINPVLLPITPPTTRACASCNVSSPCGHMAPRLGRACILCSNVLGQDVRGQFPFHKASSRPRSWRAWHQ